LLLLFGLWEFVFYDLLLFVAVLSARGVQQSHSYNDRPFFSVAGCGWHRTTNTSVSPRGLSVLLVRLGYGRSSNCFFHGHPISD
jgi:hypothetical protein